MCIIFPVVAAVVLVTIGYFALLTSLQQNTLKGMAAFGKVMSIILFIMAGLVVLASLASGPRCHGKTGRNMSWNKHCSFQGMDRMQKMTGERPGTMGQRGRMSFKGMSSGKNMKQIETENK